MSTSCQQMRSTIRSLAPISIYASETPKEPLDAQHLDSGLTSKVLYFNTTQWFPRTRCILPEKTNMANKLAIMVESESETSVISPAEQVRLNKLLAKMDSTVGMERQHKLDRSKSVTKKLKEMRSERAKTAGKSWYQLGRPEMTDELRTELTVLQLSKYANPGQFRKYGAKAGQEQYFEVGYVVAPAAAKYTEKTSSSMDGKVRKSAKLGFVDTLLQDQKYRKYAKRKRQEALEKQERNAKLSRNAAAPRR